jgi:hypothetical protein
MKRGPPVRGNRGSLATPLPIPAMSRIQSTPRASVADHVIDAFLVKHSLPPFGVLYELLRRCRPITNSSPTITDPSVYPPPSFIAFQEDIGINAKRDKKTAVSTLADCLAKLSLDFSAKSVARLLYGEGPQGGLMWACGLTTRLSGKLRRSAGMAIRTLAQTLGPSFQHHALFISAVCNANSEQRAAMRLELHGDPATHTNGDAKACAAVLHDALSKLLSPRKFFSGVRGVAHPRAGGAREAGRDAGNHAQGGAKELRAGRSRQQAAGTAGHLQGPAREEKHPQGIQRSPIPQELSGTAVGSILWFVLILAHNVSDWQPYPCQVQRPPQTPKPSPLPAPGASPESRLSRRAFSKRRDSSG